MLNFHEFRTLKYTCFKISLAIINKTKQSYTQLESRKQVIAFKDRVAIIHKGSSTPTKMTKIYRRQIQ